LRAFVAVAKLKSFTQAATVLHVSQPTLTAQIKKLEDALRLRLFARRRCMEPFRTAVRGHAPMPVSTCVKMTTLPLEP
jgi:hypothetical protein